MSAAAVNVSIVATFHAEGPLISKTLRTIEDARILALSQEVSTECLLIGDHPDLPTLDLVRSYISNSPLQWHLEQVDCHDVGQARNAAVVLACGEFICIFDGDDYMSSEWITKAFHLAQKSKQAAIFHPEFVVSFGTVRDATRQFGTDSPRFTREILLAANLWNSCAFAGRDVFISVPYPATAGKESGFGFEDWHWNCETLAQGYSHFIVPGSLHLVRKKEAGSLSRAQSSARALIPPTSLLGACT